MDLARRAKAKLVAWVDDIPGGSQDSYECDPFSYAARRDDAGTARPPPAWGGCAANPVGRALDDGERTEADSCLPFGEKRGRFGTNEEVRQVGGDGDYGGGGSYGGRPLLRGAEAVAQRRVWSFEVFPPPLPASAVAGIGAAAAGAGVAARVAAGAIDGPRLHFCWHGHLPIFAVARPDPQFRERPGQWIIELYQVGSSGNARGIPAVVGEDDLYGGSGVGGHGGDQVGGSTGAGDGGAGYGGAGDAGGAAPPFRLQLGKNKGAVRHIAFQPHGGTNLLVGCTDSLWLAQFTMAESAAAAGGAAAVSGGGAGDMGGVGGGSRRGFCIALAWLACVYHCPPLTGFPAKLQRRLLGLGARASPTFLQDVAWSADGARLAACFSGEECLRVWDADLLVARDRVGAQPLHRQVAVPLCRDGLRTLEWSPTGAYLFAAHATGGRATVWETSRWDFHQWDADCRTATWAATSAGPALAGREVLFTVERAPIDSGSDVEEEEEEVEDEEEAGGDGDHDDGAGNAGAGNNGGGGDGAAAARSPAAAAAAERHEGAYTAVKAYAFSVAQPLCDHEHYALDVGGDSLLDIRDVVAAGAGRGLGGRAAAAARRRHGDHEDGNDDDDDDDAAGVAMLPPQHLEILDIAITSNAARLVVSHTTPERVAAVSVFQLSLEPAIQASFRQTLEWPRQSLQDPADPTRYVALATELTHIEFFARPTPVDGNLHPAHLLLVQAREPVLNLLSFVLSEDDDDLI